MVSKETPWTQEQLDLIKSTVAKGATNDELKLFLYTAKRTGLDPLTRQIHFVKRGQQMTVQTGIDGYRTIAERTGKIAGIDDAIYEGDSPTDAHPIKATVSVYRMVEGQRVAFTASARWDEYAPTGSQAFMWTKMPYLMLGKCAEALALRKAFPNDLTGLYTNEEMDQADRTPASAPKTPPSAVLSEPEIQIEEVAIDEEPEEAGVSDRTKISHLCKILGIDLFAPDMKDRIRAFTSLDVSDEKNYGEIIMRLEAVVKERKDSHI